MSLSDAFRLVAERKIEAAIEEGAFDHLPARGPIDCSKSGEAFMRDWFAKRIEAPLREAP